MEKEMMESWRDGMVILQSTVPIASGKIINYKIERLKKWVPVVHALIRCIGLIKPIFYYKLITNN